MCPNPTSDSPSSGPPVRPEDARPKFLVGRMLPFPSGTFHMGHARDFVIGDALARYRRMKGLRVLCPVGWDAFGVPAQAAAEAEGATPQAWVAANIAAMRGALQQLDLLLDWDHEVVTCDPHIYGAQQAAFLDLLDAGLAYVRQETVHWDPVAGVALLDAQVVDGRAWISGAPVEQRTVNRWFLRGSPFTQALREGLDRLDHWPEAVRDAQRAWLADTEAALVEDPDAADLADWELLRTHAWGCPIPVIHCARCGPVGVPRHELPVALPDETTEHATADLETRCPECDQPARRDDATMDPFVDAALAVLLWTGTAPPRDPEAAARWLPADQYVTHADQAVLHLLQVRLLCRALRHCGRLPFDEPITGLITPGAVRHETYQDAQGRRLSPAQVTVGANGRMESAVDSQAVEVGPAEPMSRSRGNVVTIAMAAEDSALNGARWFLLTNAPPQDDVLWSRAGIATAEHTLVRMRALAREAATLSAALADPVPPPGSPGPDAGALQHAAAELTTRVGDEMERARFDRAAAHILAFLDTCEGALAPARAQGPASADLAWAARMAGQQLALAVAPLVPAVAEECWAALGLGGSPADASWPAHAA